MNAHDDKEPLMSKILLIPPAGTGRWSRLALTLTLLGGGALWGGCSMTGCGAAMETAPGVAEGSDDTAVELQAAANLAGAYQARAGAKEALRGLLLVQRSDGKSFVAERQVSGCQHLQRLEGTWRVSGSNLTLDIKGGASERYRYERSTTGLTLYDGAIRVAQLGKEASYCTRSSDCDLQSFAHAQCAGHGYCTASQRCGFLCGSEVKRGYGDMCGGFAGLRCEASLGCNLEDPRGCDVKKPFPDQAGVCRSSAAPAGCDGYLCVQGERCQLSDGAPTCAPEKVDVCMRVRCTSERPHCVEPLLAGGNAACIPADQCHRDSECGAGQRCAAADNPSEPGVIQPLICR